MSKPFVSIAIPAHNEELSIGKTLEDVFAQDYEGKFEVIVCDNNSTDRTAEIAEAAGAKVVTEKRKGTRFAYDAAMKAATGEIILATNADVHLPHNWISKIVAAYDDPHVVGVGTRVTFFNAPKWVNAFLDLSNNKLNPKPAMWGVSLSCRRSAYEQVGGFNHAVNTNEDAVFTLLIEKLGKVVILKDVVVEMDGRRFNQGFAKAVKEWTRSYGLNSLFIQASYLLKGEISTLTTDFGDYRSQVFGKGEEVQIAVVIPTGNDQIDIARVLTSLEHQDFMYRFKIYVLDNGSTDHTMAIAKTFKDVTVVSYPDLYNFGGKLARLLRSINAAVVAITAPQAFLPDDWLSQIYNAFNKDSDHKIDILTGPYTTIRNAKITDKPLHRITTKLDPHNFAISAKVAKLIFTAKGDQETVMHKFTEEVADRDLNIRYEPKFQATYLGEEPLDIPHSLRLTWQKITKQRE